jgi:hypothetical protein
MMELGKSAGHTSYTQDGSEEKPYLRAYRVPSSEVT